GRGRPDGVRSACGGGSARSRLGHRFRIILRRASRYSTDMPRVRAGRLEDFPSGRPVLLETDGRRIAVVRRGDDVHALLDACPHAGGPLSDGMVVGDALACPYHTWTWDLRTGSCTLPGRDARALVFRTSVEAGEVWI